MKSSFVDPLKIESVFKLQSKPALEVSDGMTSEEDRNFAKCLGKNAPKYWLTDLSKGELAYSSLYDYESDKNYILLYEYIAQGHGGDSDLVKNFEKSILFENCTSNMFKSVILQSLNGSESNMVWTDYSFTKYSNVNFGPNTRGWVLNGKIEDSANLGLNVRAYMVFTIFNDIEGAFLIISTTTPGTNSNDDYFNIFIPNLTNLMEINLNRVQSRA